jgi:hypothetical protein
LDGDGDQRPDQGASDPPDGAEPPTKRARFHDIAPGITSHKGLKPKRLDPHLPTRLQGFFRIPYNSFHLFGVARETWRRNDALATIA